ncbi:MAG: hypothetical protein KUG77_08940 [Nannocystaceae bacterium]|nr:hypothetical protein [Nannocystaceae bacterium]
MRTARVFMLAGAASLLLPVAACSKKSSPETVEPASASEPVAPPKTDEGDLASGKGAVIPDADKVQVLASFEGVQDMLSAAMELKARIDGEDPSGDPLAEVQAGLLAQGFGPGFLGNINLDGIHAIKVAFPTGDAAGPEAIDFAASMSVSDGQKVLESFPSSMRPQPLGGEMWELRQDNDTLLIKEAGAELLWGRAQPDVEKAAGLIKTVGTGRRVRVRAWNIPADDVDPLELLGLPRDAPFVGAVADILKELGAAELQIDFGTKKQLELVASAEAPFGKLGLEPLGKVRTKATQLEAKLPAGAVFVTTVSFGNPELLHKTIDSQIPIDQVPAPFDTMVKDAIKGTHMVLNSISANVVVALYVDNKGQATVMLAAGIKGKKEEKALAGMRKIQGTMKVGLEAHAALQGKNQNAKFAVTLKEGGLKISGIKADKLTVKIPKDFQSDAKDAALFLKKNSVESVSFVQDGVAFWAIGAGARSLGSDVARSLGKDRTSSMASEGTLTTLREGMDGCQLCISFDADEYLRVRLLDMRAKTTDKAELKEIKKQLGKLGKIKGEAEVGLGLRFSDKDGTAGLVVPTSTLALSKDSVSGLTEVMDFVDGSGGKAAEAPSK